MLTGIYIRTKGKKFPKELYPNFGMRNKKMSEETKQKIRDNAKINPNFGTSGKPQSEEHKRKNREAHEGKKQTEETIDKRKQTISDPQWRETKGKIWSENLSRALKGKHKSEIHIRHVLEALYNRPTSFEQKISSLCFKYNLPFIYTGNGNFLINFKNPDFTNEQDKIVIEVFYSYFKIRDYGSVENYKEFCKNKYEPAGWKVVFIDELDLSNKNWEEVCLNKIKEIYVKC